VSQRTSCVVEACVASPTSLPQSRWWNTSGIGSRRTALRGHAAEWTCAWSWKRVLIGMSWMPVAAWISAAGTIGKTRSKAPVVRASRYATGSSMRRPAPSKRP
jgi:hypothetical protein